MPQTKLALVCLAGIAACGQSQDGASPGQASGALVVLHTRSAIVTAPAADWDRNPFRERVDGFYPAVCLDRDDDHNHVPDSMDVARSEDDNGSDELEHQCHPCNRGPGKSGDFRVRVEGDRAELDRGRVFQRADDGTLTIPSSDGPITVVVSGATRIDDGDPTPGSEIRVQGSVSAAGPRTIAASELEVLCPGPAPIGDDDLPPGTEPVPTDPPPPACAARDFRCATNAVCCQGLICETNAAGDSVCGPIP